MTDDLRGRVDDHDRRIAECERVLGAHGARLTLVEETSEQLTEMVARTNIDVAGMRNEMASLRGDVRIEFQDFRRAVTDSVDEMSQQVRKLRSEQQAQISVNQDTRHSMRVVARLFALCLFAIASIFVVLSVESGVFPFIANVTGIPLDLIPLWAVKLVLAGGLFSMGLAMFWSRVKNATFWFLGIGQ